MDNKSKLAVKICGMKEATNIHSLLDLTIDYIGFIFYDKSPRFVGRLNPALIQHSSVKKVGVFVDETIENILSIKTTFGLDIIQLHGRETPEFCKAFKGQNVNIWKAFGVDEKFDFKELEAYADVVDVFLFDTKTPQHGGSGKGFDWSLLGNYFGTTPYLLSGGIGLHNLSEVLKIKDNRLVGVDLNSKLEIEPGLKNINSVKEALKIIHHE